MLVGTGAHLDAAAYAVGTGGGGDLERFPLVAVDLRCLGKIDSGVVTRNLHRLGGKRDRQAECETGGQHRQA
ncbi:hypothetical protein D3C87_1965520 [compost metagenome]